MGNTPTKYNQKSFKEYAYMDTKIDFIVDGFMRKYCAHILSDIASLIMMFYKLKTTYFR